MQTYDGTLNRNNLSVIAGCMVKIVFMLCFAVRYGTFFGCKLCIAVCYMSDLSNDFIAHFQIFYVIVASREL